MKKTLAASLTALTLVSGNFAFAQSNSSDTAAQQNTQQAQQVIKTLATSLKGELKQAMKNGGPIAAIETCNLKAPQIAAAVSDKGDWQISRTALKLRNPDNAPDAWEKAGLQQFQQAIASGEDPKGLVIKQQVMIDGKAHLRVLKAIPTGKACLNCHGDNLKPAVAKTLAKLYPKDQATGFKQGELRGAFSLQKPL